MDLLNRLNNLILDAEQKAEYYDEENTKLLSMLKKSDDKYSKLLEEHCELADTCYDLKKEIKKLNRKLKNKN